MRGDAFLRDAVHLFGANLHFEMLAVRTHDGGMQRLVEIRTRNGDEILDAAWNRTPLVVDHAKSGVAILHGVGDDAQGHQVVDLLDRDLLPLELLINRIRAFEASFHTRRNSFAP